MGHGRNTAPVSGTKIRQRREDAGLTFRDLAELCGQHGKAATPKQLVDFEHDRSRPRPDLLRALASALGTTIADLLDRESADDDSAVAS